MVHMKTCTHSSLVFSSDKKYKEKQLVYFFWESEQWKAFLLAIKRKEKWKSESFKSERSAVVFSFILFFTYHYRISPFQEENDQVRTESVK